MSEINKNSAKNWVKGYKLFLPDWTCRNKQYACPGVFEEDVKPILCMSGMHFCYELKDCFYYSTTGNINSLYHFAEVIAYGDIDREYPKACTNKLIIVREIPYDEVLEKFDANSSENIGRFNDGFRNTGDLNCGDKNTGNNNYGRTNTGYYNFGSSNSGDYNYGCYNTGSMNFGNFNVGRNNCGEHNTGNSNVGSYNTGIFNIGSFNTGDYNHTDRSSGAFNTIEGTISMFNKPTNWTYDRFVNSMACSIIYRLMNAYRKPISSHNCENITSEEKDFYGNAIKHTYHILKSDENAMENVQKSWDFLDIPDKILVMSLPNFDPEIFKECTGIDTFSDFKTLIIDAHARRSDT